MRRLLKFLFVPLLCSYAYAQTPNRPLKIESDSVKILNAELVLRNRTSNVPGYLYNSGNGATVFQKLGKAVEFTAGDAGYPAVGDSVFQHTELARHAIKVIRNGLLQYQDTNNGIIVDATSGKIIFRPALQTNDHIFIEAIFGLDLSINGTGGGPVIPGAGGPLKLTPGATDNGNNTFTLRWAANAKTLYLSPKVVGIGSSTLAGTGLTAPNRLGDRIISWLSSNTASHNWINLAVPGYSSRDILPVANGGVMGQNIETALQLKPDFIYVSLPSNDPGAGISVLQSMANLRKVDTLGMKAGITVFFQTTQPRTSYSLAQRQMLKLLADSIRRAWPDRYVEAFADVEDPYNEGAILAAYSQSDNIHLNAAGNQLIASHLFDRWMQYFQPITGVKRYIIDSSLNQVNWAEFAQQPDANVVKAIYNRHNTDPHYYRVRAELRDGTYITSPIARLDAPSDLPGVNDFTYRLLTDLGGDGVTTLNGSNQPDGRPTPSPDQWGKYWNNWFGVGGVAGFAENANIADMRTTTNEATEMSLQFLGTPTGSFGTSPTKAINYNGFTVPSGDYPSQALYDNVFLHSSLTAGDGIVLRIKGMVPTNQYYIKIWGARLDDGSASRTLQAKLEGSGWETAQSVETKYPNNGTPNYEQAIRFNHITGYDSLDIRMKVGGTGTFAHISLIDIGVMGPLPAIAQIRLRDTTTTLSTMQLTATPVNGAVVSNYSWTQLSGPSTATIGSPATASPSISGLSNGIYVFQVTGTSSGGPTYKSTSTVKVFPDNNGLKTWRMHFSKTAMPALPGWLNIFGSPHAERITITDPVTNWTIDNLSATPAYWAPYASNSASSTDGTTTGNNSGVIPDIALQGLWFNYSLKYSAGMDNLVISGLDPSKTYRLKFYASRNGTTAAAPRSGAWRINGGTEYLQNAYNNTTLETVATAIAPDSNGNIRLSVHAPTSNTNGAFGYLNALVIQEE